MADINSPTSVSEPDPTTAGPSTIQTKTMAVEDSSTPKTTPATKTTTTTTAPAPAPASSTASPTVNNPLLQHDSNASAATPPTTAGSAKSKPFTVDIAPRPAPTVVAVNPQPAVAAVTASATTAAPGSASGATTTTKKKYPKKKTKAKTSKKTVTKTSKKQKTGTTNFSLHNKTVWYLGGNQVVKLLTSVDGDFDPKILGSLEPVASTIGELALSVESLVSDDTTTVGGFESSLLEQIASNTLTGKKMMAMTDAAAQPAAVAKTKKSKSNTKSSTSTTIDESAVPVQQKPKQKQQKQKKAQQQQQQQQPLQPPAAQVPSPVNPGPTSVQVQPQQASSVPNPLLGSESYRPVPNPLAPTSITPPASPGSTNANSGASTDSSSPPSQSSTPSKKRPAQSQPSSSLVDSAPATTMTDMPPTKLARRMSISSQSSSTSSLTEVAKASDQITSNPLDGNASTTLTAR